MYSTEEEEEEEDIDIIRIPVRHHPTNGGAARQQRGGKYGDGWVKEKPSKQDRISADPILLREELREYQLIKPEEYQRITPGTFVRYIRYDTQNNPKLRLGGYLIKNGYPDYWVLRSGRGQKRVSWSVPLKGDVTRGRLANQYYRKQGVMPDEKTKYGVEVFEALASGRYMLVPTEVLEELTGDDTLPRPRARRPQRQRRIVLEGESESESEERRQPKLRARFRDESISSDDDDEW